MLFKAPTSMDDKLRKYGSSLARSKEEARRQVIYTDRPALVISVSHLTFYKYLLI